MKIISMSDRSYYRLKALVRDRSLLINSDFKAIHSDEYMRLKKEIEGDIASLVQAVVGATHDAEEA